MDVKDIRSISALNAHGGGFNLAACFHSGNGHPMFVHISRSAYARTEGDKALLKKLFIDTYKAVGSIKL